MTPEERRAIAIERTRINNHSFRQYPECCPYHEGFDDALGLLVDRGYRGQGLFGPKVYAIEDAP